MSAEGDGSYVCVGGGGVGGCPGEVDTTQNKQSVHFPIEIKWTLFFSSFPFAPILFRFGMRSLGGLIWRVGLLFYPVASAPAQNST